MIPQPPLVLPLVRLEPSKILRARHAISVNPHVLNAPDLQLIAQLVHQIHTSILVPASTHAQQTPTPMQTPRFAQIALLIAENAILPVAFNVILDSSLQPVDYARAAILIAHLAVAQRATVRLANRISSSIRRHPLALTRALKKLTFFPTELLVLLAIPPALHVQGPQQQSARPVQLVS